MPFGGPQIGLPVDLLTSSPLTWLGRSDAGENSPHHTLADPITQPGTLLWVRVGGCFCRAHRL